MKSRAGRMSACVVAAVAAAVHSASGGAAAQDRPEPTFARDVAPILYRHCVSCHRPGGPGPFALLSYDDARVRARLLAEVTKSRYMPPWKPEPGHGAFAGERRLTEGEIATIERWAMTGAPKGREMDLPPPPPSTNGWQLGAPDLVSRMSEPFELGADGADRYRIFVIPIPLSETRYVQAVEFRAGDTRAVHHATILIDSTSASRNRDAADPAPGYDGDFAPRADYPNGHFLGWAPGQQPRRDRPGLSWVLRPGSDLVVQLHLKPTGRPERIQVSIGLFFTPDPPTRPLTMLRLAREDIDIPAGAGRHVVSDSFVLPADVVVYAIQPHAHYRATAVTASATLPDGTKRRLISIPQWDFDWQDRYEYADPIPLPRGSTVSMQFTFDNSDSNPRNPDHPPRRIRWGQSSNDEMAEVLLQLAPRTAADLPELEAAFVRKHRRDVIAGYETRLSLTPDAAVLHEDVATLYIEDGRPADALRHLDAAIRLAPSAAAYTNVGVVLTLQGRVDDAVAQYRRALAIDASYAEAHSNLSAALLYLGDTANALDHARRAIDLAPRLAAAHYNLARALAAADRVQDAIGAARQALELAAAGDPLRHAIEQLLSDYR